MLFNVVDIETTGFNTVNDDILEVGFIRCNQDFQIITHGVLYFYKPEFQVESAAQKVHGLTRTMLKEHESEFERNMVTLYTLVQKGVLVGKNSDKFDIPFIREFILKYAGSLCHTCQFACSIDMQTRMSGRFQEWYKRTYGSVTRRAGRLEEYMGVLGLTGEDVRMKYVQLFPEMGKRQQAHSALYDAFMTYLVFRWEGEQILS